ncbi:MAG: response regulator, partial [Calditrichota bacterium]
AGEGTTMRIYLPCLEPGEMKGEGAWSNDPAARPGSGYAVLVIEDEETVRDLACDLLKSRGYSVMVAEDGLGGLEVFRQHHHEIDLVVLDLLMPGPDGTEIFNQLKYIQSDIPIVIATGLREVQEVGQLLDSGADGVILKPFAIEDFLSKIEKVLKKNG